MAWKKGIESGNFYTALIGHLTKFSREKPQLPSWKNRGRVEGRFFVKIQGTDCKDLLQELISDLHENYGCGNLIFEAGASSVGKVGDLASRWFFALTLSELVTQSACCGRLKTQRNDRDSGS